ncbi:MAG: penicillin-binding protein activator [Deltaproteobacteria bacterium]|nr:penicillin-binding protein activator [Deltaproteobacteria bacterium]
MQAEENFQAKSYIKALELYNEYFYRFPHAPLAPAALLKTGAIYSAQNNYSKARYAYRQMIVKYPDSHFLPYAMLDILFSYYREGRYKEGIRYGDEIPDNKISSGHIIRKYTIIGDAYMAMGFPLDAVYAFTAGYKKSKTPENKLIMEKLKTAIHQLDSQQIVSLLNRMEDPSPAGYFMFELGLKHAKEGKYKNAVSVLSEFIEKFPEHENTQEAVNLIEEFNTQIGYERYTIGCLLPLSGRYKAFGNKALKGIELAKWQFDSSGFHPSINIIIKDTASDPEKTALAVKQLSEKNVAAIIGPMITAQSAAREAQARQIPIITLTQKENITDSGDYVFRNFLTPSMQVKAIVSYTIENLGLSRFAILYPDEKYGTTFLNLFRDEVMAKGGEVVKVESYDSAHTDFATPIKKLGGIYDKNTEAVVDFDAIFIPDGPDKVGLIIPQLVYYDVKDIQLLGTNLWHSDKLITMAKKYIQGAIMPEFFFEEKSSEAVREFVNNFENIFKEKPGFIEAVFYDTAMILFQTISQPDTHSRALIKEELMNMDAFQGVTGLTSFNQNGEAVKKPCLLKIKADGFVEIKDW